MMNLDLIPACEMRAAWDVCKWGHRYKGSRKRKHLTRVEYLRQVLLHLSWVPRYHPNLDTVEIHLRCGDQDTSQVFEDEAQQTIDILTTLGYVVSKSPQLAGFHHKLIILTVTVPPA